MRVSDLGLQQLLLSGFQNTSESAQARQIQLSTGDKFQTYGEYGADALRLISAEGVFTRANAYENAAQIALTRLETQGESLTIINESLEELRAGIIRTLSTGNAELLGPQFETSAQQIISALNVDVGGVHLFGGDDGVAPPVNARSLSDIAAAPSIASLFSEGAEVSLAVEENVFVNGGPLASNVASDLFTAFAGFENASSTLGAFSGNLTNAQRDFLVTLSAELGAISEQLIQDAGASAIAQGQAADAVDRNVRRRDLAEVVAAEIEDVDIAEALARLNQDQLAIEASARALGQATQLSLLNFI